MYAVPAAGCSPEAGEDEDVQVFERRRPTCELFCDMMFVPECGSIDPPHESVDSCVQFCISEDAEVFRLQADDSDACLDEVAEVYECAAAASCDEQWIIYNNPAQVAETPCEAALEAQFDCISSHPDENRG
ncbi:MAG: hypothetical protein AAGA54_07095 [Myxococcota bacterium]